MRTLLAIWAAVIVAAHIYFLPPSPDSLDSLTAALAVRGIHPAEAPLAPPLFTAAARVVTAALHRAGDPLNAAHALALLNIIGAAAAALAMFALARGLRLSPERAVAAALVSAAVPLWWFTASRPIGDLAAAAVAIAAQACLARVWFGAGPMYAFAGGALAAAAMGFHFAMGVLTLPLALAAIVFRQSTVSGRFASMAGLVLGFTAWVIPAVLTAGGAGLLRALGRVFTISPESVIVTRTLGAARDALYATFIDPFGPLLFAAIVLAVAAIGLAMAALRERHVLAVLALGYVPYLLMHLLAADPNVARGALPIVPALALLFVLPLDRLRYRRAVLPIAAAAAAAGVAIATPALHAYAASQAPGFAVIRDLHTLPRPGDSVLAMHQRVASDLTRHQAWTALPSMHTLPWTPDYEWLELAKLWLEGHEGPVWFLAESRRTDLRMIDPQRRHLMRQYRWPEESFPFMRGVRPDRLNWFFIQRPGWFLGRGWAVSPEIGGLTARDRVPGEAPVAWVRRRDLPSTMLLGGRNLGAPGDPLVVVRVKIDGRQIDEWPIAPGPFVFMRPILPEEIAGDGTYARLEIDASQDGSAAAPISLEQFDLQPIDGTLVAYDAGWWEPEYSARTGQAWRWTSGQSTLWLYNPGRDLTLVISGEDPTRYYGGPVEMIVRAGDRELARWTLDDHFTRAVTIPAEPLSVARGRITLHLSHTHVPGRIRISPDQRELGVRIFDVSVH